MKIDYKNLWICLYKFIDWSLHLLLLVYGNWWTNWKLFIFTGASASIQISVAARRSLRKKIKSVDISPYSTAVVTGGGGSVKYSLDVRDDD